MTLIDSKTRFLTREDTVVATMVTVVASMACHLITVRLCKSRGEVETG